MALWFRGRRSIFPVSERSHCAIPPPILLIVEFWVHSVFNVVFELVFHGLSLKRRNSEGMYLKSWKVLELPRSNSVYCEIIVTLYGYSLAFEVSGKRFRGVLPLDQFRRDFGVALAGFTSGRLAQCFHQSL